MKEAWTIWFTGIHGSGKTTIAKRLAEILKEKNITFILLDGDDIRKTLSSDLGYTLEDRNKHMKRVADVCKLISKNGVIAIAATASPTQKSREYAKSVLRNMVQVYVKCPLKVCETRDVKGHYKKAKNKEDGFKNFLSMSLEFEEPKNPDITLNTDNESVDESVNKLVSKLKEKGII